MKITFTQLELWACRELAKKIHSNKTSLVTDKTWDGASYEERNYKGIKGTYAVSKFLECDFDREIVKGKDNGWDLIFKNTPIEVKHLQKFLAFNSLEHFKCEIVVLVNPITNSEDVKIAGWTDKATFIKEHFKSNFGYGERLCMKPENLFSITSLKDIKESKI